MADVGGNGERQGSDQPALPEVPPVSGTKWRANMYRIDYDKGTAHYAWQKTNKSFHEYDKFGTFIFE